MLWRRAISEFTDLSESNGHIVQGAFLAPGETLTRMRLSWVAYHTSTSPADGVGFSIAFGAIVLPESSTAADVPNPFDSPNEDWVWWESGFMTPLTLMSNASNLVNEIDVSPPDAGRERDVRAQRMADPVEGSRVWFITGTSTLSPGQATHWFSLSYSIGVLVAP